MHAGRYGQQAGGMHPTRMQFLFSSFITKTGKQIYQCSNLKTIDRSLLFLWLFVSAATGCSTGHIPKSAMLTISVHYEALNSN